MRRRYCSVAVITIGFVFIALATVVGFRAGFAFERAQAKYVAETVDGDIAVAINVVNPHYTVSFDANGGLGTMADQDFEYGVAQELTQNAFRRPAYTFIGWNTEADGSGDSYTNHQLVSNIITTPTGTGTVTLYAQWELGLHTIFVQEGACTFGGANGITGDECADYVGETYIDTGVELYNEEYYDADYEIGFTIVYYNPSDGDDGNVAQATFMNSKYENAAAHYPGLVVRKSGTNKIEFTQTIHNVKAQPTQTINGVVENMEVVVKRVDEVVYYSINGGAFKLIQSMKNTNDYIPDGLVTVWFGAASDVNGDPFRILNATLSHMYVKRGDPKTKYTVTFDPQGGVVDPTSKEVYEMHALGTLPTIEWTDHSNEHYFVGWYTEPNGGGQRVTVDTVVESDMTVYAYWSLDRNVCEINGIGKETVQECIDAAGTTPATVTLTKDVAEYVDVAVGQDITFVLGSHIMSDEGSNDAVIENYGITRIADGIFTSAQERTAVINNKSTGKLYVYGDVKVIDTGKRQAIYNEGGEVKISGNVYLYSVSQERATVQNESNGGLITILGGTIVSESQQGVNNKAGTLVIGSKDGSIASAPVIRGATYGITTTTNISIYDGIFMGVSAGVENESKITDIETGANAVHSTEIIDNITYNTLYYTK